MFFKYILVSSQKTVHIILQSRLIQATMKSEKKENQKCFAPMKVLKLRAKTIKDHSI